jgi:hypothetical protein
MIKNATATRLAALISAAMFLLFLFATAQAQQPLQVLHNHVRPVVAKGQAVPVGLLPPSQRLSLAIMLPLRNQTDLTGLLSRPPGGPAWPLLRVKTHGPG